MANGQWLKAKKIFRFSSFISRLFRIFAQKIIDYGYSTTKT